MTTAHSPSATTRIWAPIATSMPLTAKSTIGSHVAVGPGTKLFAYSNHYQPGQLVTGTKTQRDVTIGANVFIGANSVILGGSTIEDNVVAGAGPVVTGSFAAGGVY